MNFQKKVVIVTGAGNGIGKAIAVEYAKAGAYVVIADNDDKAANQTLDLIQLTQIGKGVFIKTDIRNYDEVTHLMKETFNQFGRIDILVNNAGVSRFKSMYELTLEDWDDVLNTNLRGTFLCAKAAAAYIRSNKAGGSIVNIASTRAFMSEKNSEAYAASKGGITALTHALSISLQDDQITVNAISPGWIETGDYADLRTIDHKQHPSNRVGTPEDIARACLFLTNPDNNFITGENLIVDGGMTRKMIYEH
ncbi:glucose 1-dehydrogenase [Aquibacillus rhizosphaerae]|uniref:SDR family oxidoreductase n=1 Tax=Aquibacillus rhizosphaerae TaxID=3051431 RepID=A0ABT7L3K4_9BACI|nr:glucose 1-dehydrogenase [Aquibacillus sp. LR5S19]MDL4840453.1 SDR family oxidoreductase [Aquibacillus sp. LR5S19]